MKKYIALYQSGAVRDAQLCKEDPGTASPLDEDVWEDCFDAQVYIGLFYGMDEQAARKAAAESEGCSQNCVCLVPVAEQEEFHYLLKFAAGADFNAGGLAERQLRALWTAYCFHESLDVDTAGYDRRLQALYQQLPAGDTIWHSFGEFGNYMCKHLV
ncbi:hypothetical protein [uncultured Flavonifractor sp.]|uniref:hypothetical protein n=1 Tax=uncultured Flavonifractor sp. TaxID=1193534 RepID=UPI0025990249|nr:hypothetical protein [uncultured Flavonifractor sp.]